MARPLSPLLRGADEVVAETFKVLVLGNSDVGKTSLIRLYTTGETAANLIPTVGIDFTDVVVTVRRTKVRLRVWDTAGQERFYTFTKQFFRGTQGILLMYDITSMTSYQTLMKWLQTVNEVGLEGVTMVVVGNKVDLEDRREVPLETATKLASRHGYEYVETSAITGKNVKKAFYKLAEALIYSRGIFLPGEEAEAHSRKAGSLERLDSDGSDISPQVASREPFRLEEEERRRKRRRRRRWRRSAQGQERLDGEDSCCR